MTKQVLYCLATGVVVEWQDTEQFAYAAPSSALGVLPVTAEQWKCKEALHYVFGGALSRVETPQPSAVHEWDGSQWTADASQVVMLEQEKVEHLCSRVDAEADSVRQVLFGDPLRVMEYAQAAAEARLFKESGYPKKVVPPAVSAWVAKGRTAKQAADEMLEKAAESDSKLLAIRTLRLQAKERIRAQAAKGKQDAAQDACEAAIQAIRQVVDS
ncbi:hypothetical protein [Pseudomonas sp. NFIX28]|uniref:hypothetical protein n=1 Tax=Pseudomonas sp. NFIX28 TaxID=1566235 RepID=UPI000895615B|nr:hypothetical protein [Pseudomonas sp. NFIX28]SDY84598.1 hypothetical protein SAMN03159453_01530 [Pseudomonas sp. NFIX28]